MPPTLHRRSGAFLHPPEKCGFVLDTSSTTTRDRPLKTYLTQLLVLATPRPDRHLLGRPGSARELETRTPTASPGNQSVTRTHWLTVKLPPAIRGAAPSIATEAGTLQAGC